MLDIATVENRKRLMDYYQKSSLKEDMKTKNRIINTKNDFFVSSQTKSCLLMLDV